MAGSNLNDMIDVERQPIAAVYAKALLGAMRAAEPGTEQKVDALAGELDALVVEVLDRQKAFEQALASGLISQEEKIQILDRVFHGRISQDLLIFLKVLAAHGGLDCLRAIRGELHRQLNSLRDRSTVVLRVASKIDDRLSGEIAAVIRTQLGIEPDLKVVTDRSLIGGMILQVGDTVYDGSVATRLKQVRSEMVDTFVENMQASRERFVAG